MGKQRKKMCEWHGCKKPAEGEIKISIEEDGSEFVRGYCKEHFFKFKNEYEARYQQKGDFV